MANRFLSNIRINDAYTFPASDGNDGQVITTDGAGNLAFENVSPDAYQFVISFILLYKFLHSIIALSILSFCK